MERSRRIIQTSVLGIVVNVVLVLFKMAVGLLAHSIAIILDAVNNLSDALSSVITIVGTKLSEKAPDKKHPFGHGRVEYLTSMAIAVIVLLAGLTSLKESVEKIFHPEAASYSIVSLVIIAAAVAAKLWIGQHVKRVGKQLNAQSLVASGSDALFDAILSFATLVAAGISMLWGLRLEGWLGAVISLIILKSGVEILRETLDSIIGTRADPELTESMKGKICAFPGVLGAYDLTLHNYGPTRIIGSVHIEVPDDMPARELHKLTRMISARIAMEYGVILTVGVYAANDSDPEINEIKQTLVSLVSQHPEILQMHGFYADKALKCVMFDLILNFQTDAEAVKAQLLRQAAALFPDWRFDVVLDTDYSE